MENALYEQYKAVLAHQEALCERLTAELKQCMTTVESLRAALAAHDTEQEQLNKLIPFLPTMAAPTASVELPSTSVFAGISVRWAVMCLMAEYAVEAMGTKEIADTLLAGGVHTSAQNFPANVSAVVSLMVQKDELSSVEGKYAITAHGREVWGGIQQTRQYRYRRAAMSQPSQKGGENEGIQ